MTLMLFLLLILVPNAASPVDSILDKEEYTLEELLDEDELIQECKSLNSRLTTFLKQKESVEKLVRTVLIDKAARFGLELPTSLIAQGLGLDFRRRPTSYIKIKCILCAPFLTL